MADNRISQSRRPAAPDQKNEDPLAELARIVGFEDEDSKAAEQNAGPAGAESGFDLEAELMRELQIDVGDDAGPSVPEPTFAPAEPEFAPEIQAPVQPDIQATASKIANEQTAAAPQPVPSAQSAEPAQPAEEGAWPHATTDTAAQLNSLEAELQAAFSALEGKRPQPETVAETEPQAEPVQQAAAAEPPAPAPAPAPAEEPVQMPVASAEPIDALAESDQLKEAYDRLQRDIEAARPVEEDLDDGGSELTDMLLAEMAEVEAEATDNMPAGMPFDASDIAESDHVPEAMADLEVPDYEPEPVAPLRPKDNDFGLPLEDELDVLTAPDPMQEQASLHQQQPQAYAQTEPRSGAAVAQHAAVGAGHYAAAAQQAAQPQYDDEPGMEGYPEEYDDDVFPGDDDFAAEDLVPPNFGEFEDERSQGSGRKGLIAAVVVLAIAIVGGAGFYLWNSGFGGDTASNNPVIIAASEEPVKVKPDDPGGKTVPNEDLAVFEELSGKETAEPTDQNLVTTIEEPVDVVQRTLDPDTLPLEGRATASSPIAKSEERLAVSNSLDPDPSADSGTSGVAPRRVRTLVVKPDGTIVAREDPAPQPALATANAATDAANEPIITGTTTATVGTATSTNAAPAAAAESVEIATASGSLPAVEVLRETGTAATGGSQTAAQNTALPPIDEELRNSGALPLPAAKPATAAATSNTQTAAQVASVQTGDQRAAASAPVPTTRPAEQPVNIVEAVTERGNLAGGNANPGGYMVQISSQPSEEAARASYESLSQRYAAIIGGRGVDIQRADIENRGVFYRVRIPAGSKDNANSLCARYKTAGGSCFVAR